MKRLIKNSSFDDIENQYNTMCDAIAYDISNDEIKGGLSGLVKETIYSIENRNYLSDFEKTVRDYFKEKGLTLTNEILEKDIAKYL